MTSADPAPASHRVGPAALWFGLFGAAVAWSIQELAGYAAIAHACYPSWQPRFIPAVSGVWTTTLIVSLLMVTLGITAGLTAYRSWRHTRRERSDEEQRQLEVGEDRARFMAISGIIVSGILLFNLLMNAVVLFLVPPCG
jgi:heme/copper-type cytochrome/quinol oxidase subunit 2